jgi:hypothetical protein
LYNMWKEIQSDYDWDTINFMKPGNHKGNLTKIAMVALRDQRLLEMEEDYFDEADEDDVFGVEEGGF